MVDRNAQIYPQPAEPTHGTSGNASMQPGATGDPDPEVILPPEDKPGRFGSFKGIFAIVWLFVAAWLLALFINQFVLQSYQVFGQSMVPTLHDGDRLIISKVKRSLSRITGSEYKPQRGDIVVFVNPLDPSVQLIKRVIGLPDERVRVEKGVITVYNQQSPEGFNPDANAGYIKDIEPVEGVVEVTVPTGELFVSGDNRNSGGSLDSRNDLGTIPLDNLVGTLFVRIYPLTDAEVF